MKIELNTNTKGIREVRTKAETLFTEEEDRNLDADALSMFALAAATKIYYMTDNDGQRNKLADSIRIMINSFLEEAKKKTEEEIREYKEMIRTFIEDNEYDVQYVFEVAQEMLKEREENNG